MKIAEIVSFLESLAHPSLQEHYDNAGLLTGDPAWNCSGVIVSLDATEKVIKEAKEKNCNLIVAHHPIIFGALKKINGKNYAERAVISAIKNDIAIYAIHTNLDNIIGGVNGKIAEMLGLQNISVLAARENTLKKLFTFVPADKAEQVRSAIFNAGGGYIGNYSECSFNAEGTGTFKAGAGSNPYVGKEGERHYENEIKIEAVFPAWLQDDLIKAMKDAHPYEEPAYDVLNLSNTHSGTGSGVIGRLNAPMDEAAFLSHVKKIFKVPVIRHTTLRNNNKINTVAVCGGAGSFLVLKALAAGADAYITADMKYHEFFDSDNRMLIADVGHFESEQFTINLLTEVLEQKFPTFAVLKTGITTNPVHYFI
jgi:dinuclear metal center YbgI/SA1388 family protein